MSGNILTPEERGALLAVMRGRKVEALKVRRANALVAPGDGRSVRQVCRFLYLDPDTVRGWPRGFRRTGLASVDPAAYPEREGKLTRAREASLREAPPDSPPRGTNGVRDIIPPTFGREYTRGGAIKLMHRLGFEYVKPKPLPRQADRAGREAFIRQYERTVRDAPANEATVFADAVHPEWRSRPAHGRVFRGDRPAVRSTTGRRRLNLHGALNLETMKLTMVEGGRTGATTTLRLPGNRSAPVPAARRSTSSRATPATVTRRRPCPFWSGRDAASGRTSCRPTRRTRPHRAPVGGHAPPREA